MKTYFIISFLLLVLSSCAVEDNPDEISPVLVERNIPMVDTATGGRLHTQKYLTNYARIYYYKNLVLVRQNYLFESDVVINGVVINKTTPENNYSILIYCNNLPLAMFCDSNNLETAFFLATTGYKSEALEKYRELSVTHIRSGYIQLLYARQLFYTGRISEARYWLLKSRQYYVNDKTYKLKAEIETELGLYSEAENSLREAVFMVPNRMSSRYELMLFYISRADTIKAREWAKSILTMPVKLPSLKTQQMLQQAAIVSAD